MPVANITVAYVNQPKAGGKKGTIKTESGEMYGVWPEKLSQFAQGAKYTIEYDVATINGKEYKNVTRVIQGTHPAAGSQQSSGQGHNRSTAAEIFITGMMGRAYHGTGTIPLEDVAYEQMVGLRSAWERVWATKLQPAEQKSLSQELNDDIPF